MRVSILAVVLMSVLLVVTLSSCNKPSAPVNSAPPAPPPVAAPPAPAAGAPPAAPVEAPAAKPAEDPKAVVDKVGAPLYEGAEAEGVKVADGKTIATFYTSAAYKDVKAFYMEKLKKPDWTNNGMEMGAVGGDEWEWKSADAKKYVMVKKDPAKPKTEVRFTLKD